MLVINQNSRARGDNTWTGFNEAALAGSTMSEPSFDPSEETIENKKQDLRAVEKCPQKNSGKQSIKSPLAGVCADKYSSIY